MRVLLVDDHPVFLDALRSILGSYFDSIDLVARDSVAEIESLALSDFNLVIVDLSFRGKDITRDVCSLIKANPFTRVLVLTNFEDGRHIRLVSEAGAQGYLPKSTPSKILTSVIQLILAGGRYFPQDIISEDQFGAEGEESNGKTNGRSGNSVLSPRQIEVFERLARGLTISEVADGLHVSEPTIKADIAKATRALDARNRLHAICRALDAGLIHPAFE